MSDRLRQMIGIMISIPVCLAVGVSVVLLALRLEGGARTLFILALFALAVAILIAYAVRALKAISLWKGFWIFYIKK